MSAPTHIPLEAVPAVLRDEVLGSLRRYLMQEDRPLTYAEAAWLYQYQPATLRQAVHKRRLKARKLGRGRFDNVVLRHKDIRAYIQGKKCAGVPRKALKQAQQRIA